jgi:hypothetical protein
MAQLSNERRSRLFSEPPPPCRLCESRRVICVGLAGDVGFFRCLDCNGVFTIDLTAPAGDAAHDAHKGT